LTRRSQRVVVCGKSSNSKHIHAGVPQGSILGPLLFLLYVSDLSSTLENKASLFADDTTIIKPISADPIACINSVNNDMSNLLRWADLWRVTFNPLKTVYIRVSNKRHKPILNPIYLNRVAVNEVDYYPNLGIMYGNKMDWKHHLEHIANKVALRMAYLKRLQYNLPRSALEKIYLTMIRPIIEYGDIIYDNLNITQCEQLERIQRRAALICTGGYRHTEHIVLLRELGWDKLLVRRKEHRLIAYYKLLNGDAPPHIIPLLPRTVASQTTYNLRNSYNLRPRHARLTPSLNSYFPKTARDWNALPESTKNADSLHKFKKLITIDHPAKHYSKLHIGKCGIWLTRIRMGLSGLNSHRFTYNMLASPVCEKCGNEVEDTIHYLWYCPVYAPMRQQMMGRLVAETDIQIDNTNIVSILINGEIEKENHIKIYNIITDYIRNTIRFIYTLLD
jgi:ribonuclease P/MRP protein subunit RPP40